MKKFSYHFLPTIKKYIVVFDVDSTESRTIVYLDNENDAISTTINLNQVFDYITEGIIKANVVLTWNRWLIKPLSILDCKRYDTRQAASISSGAELLKFCNDNKICIVNKEVLQPEFAELFKY